MTHSYQVTKLDHVIFTIITFLYWFSLYIYVPILSPYMTHLGATYTFIGIILGSYGLMQVLIRLPLGIYSDKLRKRRPFVALGMLISAISCFGFVITDHLGMSLLFRAMSGISAATWVAFTVLYASYFPKEATTKAMGVISFITVGGQMAGMVLSGIVTEQFGWLTPFWIGGVAGLIGLFICYWLKEPKGEIVQKQVEFKELAAVIKDPVLLKVSFLSILAHSILFITMFGFTPNLALELGASTGQLAYVVLAFMIPHAIAAIAAGKWIVHRIGQWPTLMTGFCLSAFCSMSMPFLETLSWLLITQAINGFALGLVLPMLLGMSIQTIEYDKRATAMGFYQAIYALGMFLGPFLAGFLNSAGGLKLGFYLAGFTGLAAFCTIVYWRVREKRTVPIQERVRKYM